MKTQITVRHLVIDLLIILFTINLLTAPKIAAATEIYQGTFSNPPFIGEYLSYAISFWLFKNAASADMTFVKTSRGYEAVVEAQTSGVIGFLTRNMRETMKSVMRFDQKNCRFEPLLFQEVMRQGEHERKKTVEFHHEKKVMVVIYENTNREKRVIQKALPQGNIDDLLSAFYNLRLGCYGNIKQGNNVAFTVWVKETPSKILINFPRSPAKQQRPPFEAAYYAILSMDKNTTNIASKKLIGWLAHDLVPLRGMVENAYLFGDLHVRLTERRGGSH